MEREKLYEEMELKIILQSSKQSNAKEIERQGNPPRQQVEGAVRQKVGSCLIRDPGAWQRERVITGEAVN